MTKDTDETKYVVKQDLRDAYNGWVQLVQEKYKKDDTKDIEDVDATERAPGAFSPVFKEHL